MNADHPRLKLVTIPHADLKRLRQHWTRKLLPMPKQSRIDALSDDLARGVQLPPGYVAANDNPDHPYLLVAGETRRQAHIAQQRDMEFILITDDEAVNVALGENNNRQGYQYKYQTAWIYCALAEKVVDYSNSRKGFAAVNHAAGIKSNDWSLCESLDQVADLIHVSRSLLASVMKVRRDVLNWDLKNAPKVWGEGAEPTTLMDFANSRILDEDSPCTPGQVWAGVAGKEAAEAGKTNPTPKQLDLFIEGFASVRKWGKAFTKFQGPSRKAAIEAVKQAVSEWPPELRSELAAELKRIEREEREGQPTKN